MKLFVFLFAERENVATNDALDSEVFKFLFSQISNLCMLCVCYLAEL